MVITVSAVSKARQPTATSLPLSVIYGRERSASGKEERVYTKGKERKRARAGPRGSKGGFTGMILRGEGRECGPTR